MTLVSQPQLLQPPDTQIQPPALHQLSQEGEQAIFLHQRADTWGTCFNHNSQTLRGAQGANSQEIIQEFIKHVIPNIPAHRALTAPHPDGNTRDIIVKLHCYAVNEQVMSKARERSDL